MLTDSALNPRCPNIYKFSVPRSNQVMAPIIIHCGRYWPDHVLCENHTYAHPYSYTVRDSALRLWTESETAILPSVVLYCPVIKLHGSEHVKNASHKHTNQLHALVVVCCSHAFRLLRPAFIRAYKLLRLKKV